MRKPGLAPERAREIIKKAGLTGSRIVLLGLRGYYRDSMGERGANDRGIYDDAIVVISPNVYATFNANTDPSIYRKAIAVLKPGTWKYRLGTHGLSKPKNKQYVALVQADVVKVLRDTDANASTDASYEETGYFGINIHRGGYTTTSSLGCQTIFPDQWPAFIALVEQEIKRENQAVVPYHLLQYQG
jgi:lysozyme